jgi:uncharacterized protein (UPF0332 family)
MTPFEWNEYLDLAEELVQRRGDPSAERSAISRAYYAAFHSAKKYYSSRGQRLEFTGEDHRAVCNWLQGRPDRGVIKIGVALRRLLQIRRDADYTDRFPGQLSIEAQAGVATARRIISDISKLT